MYFILVYIIIIVIIIIIVVVVMRVMFLKRQRWPERRLVKNILISPLNFEPTKIRSIRLSFKRLDVIISLNFKTGDPKISYRSTVPLILGELGCSTLLFCCKAQHHIRCYRDLFKSHIVDASFSFTGELNMNSRI